MKVSDKCIELIKEFEGYHTEQADGSAKAYQDPVGIWTIGWGSTRNLDEDRPVRPGDVISMATAERWLREDVRFTASVVEDLCTVPLTQGMFDALVSFGYNVGTGQGGLRTSTLLIQLNAMDYQEAAKEFLRWTKGEVNGVLVDLPGLVRRRRAEADLFASEGLLSESPEAHKTQIISMEMVQDYRPAPVPLPFMHQVLREGDLGNDCFILNCALAGLGFLRIEPQPNGFTELTRTAVQLFQAREQITTTGQVGPTTKQALERSLIDARQRIPKASPDLVYCKLTRTYKAAYQGLERCNLEFIDPQGRVLDLLKVISGAPGAQRFKLPADSDAGSGEPIPQGRYAIGDIDWANGKDNYDASHGEGLGPVWVPLIKKQQDDRDAFGMHGDWNWITQGRAPGSAGCVVTSTLSELKQLVSLLRKHDPRELVVYWGL